MSAHVDNHIGINVLDLRINVRAYFYLVRTFGAVPIIHNNTDIIGAGTYNDQYICNLHLICPFLPSAAQFPAH